MPATQISRAQSQPLQWLSGLSSSYLGPFGISRSSNCNITASILHLVPWMNFSARTITTIGIGVVATSAWNMRIGLYNSNIDTGLPTTLLVDAGVLASGSSAGDKFITGLSTVVPAGIYHLGIVFDTTVSSAIAGGQNYLGNIGNMTGGVWTNVNSRTTPFTYGALPSDLSTGYTFTNLTGNGATGLAPMFGIK